MPENLGYQFNRLYNLPIETYRQVDNITLRNAIPDGIRWRGMLVHVISENVTYELNGGIANSNWIDAGTSPINPTTHYKGDFDATTISPALSNANGIPGDEYKVINADTGVNVDFGAGDVLLHTDDIIIFYGSEWIVKVSASESGTYDLISKSVLPLYLALNNAFRGWQGVFADENYIYTFTDRDSSFSLENIIQRYDHNGAYVDEKLNAYTGLDSLGNFMSLGSGYVDNNYVWATVSNSNSPSPDKESKVVRFNKSTLDFIQDYDIGDDSSSGLTFYNGSYYVSYHDIMVVRKFTTSFVFEEEFSLSRPLETYGGYQSIFFKDGFAFFNYHGANVYGSDYAFGVDKYSFDGSDFTFVENITPPTYGSGQQVSYANGLYYWVDRIENKIIITPDIDQTQKNLISPSLMGLHVVVEGEDNPRRILEIDNYADNIATANVFAFRKARGTKYNPTALLANSLIGGLSFRGHDGTDFDLTSGGIYMHAEEAFTPTTKGCYLSFRTAESGTIANQEKARLHGNGDFELKYGNVFINLADASDSYVRTKTSNGDFGTGTGILSATNIWSVYDFLAAANRLVILSNGNVGIGTSDPSSLLHVHNVAGTAAFYLESAITGQSHILFGAVGGKGKGDAYIKYSDNSGAIFLGTSATDRLFIQSSGNVSIGNNNNTYKLDVTGTVRFTGTAVASPATLSTELVTKGQLDASRPYKTYVAIMSQSGVSAPTVTVLENSLGGTVVWTRTAVGNYVGTLSGAFTTSKTVGFVQLNYNNSYTPGSSTVFTSFDWLTTNTVRIETVNVSGTASDGELKEASIEIRVYN